MIQTSKPSGAVYNVAHRAPQQSAARKVSLQLCSSFTTWANMPRIRKYVAKANAGTAISIKSQAAPSSRITRTNKPKAIAQPSKSRGKNNQPAADASEAVHTPGPTH